eukprot:scaffold5184_cov14-Tisochrysis_lutea.AAC.1
MCKLHQAGHQLVCLLVYKQERRGKERGGLQEGPFWERETYLYGSSARKQPSGWAAHFLGAPCPCTGLPGAPLRCR